MTLVTSANISSDWGSIENVLRKNAQAPTPAKEQEAEKQEEEEEEDTNKVVDEWTPDLEELKKELNANS